ncbi:MAG: methionyl-tRNA formyltransferase [Mycoplasmataceae bacterium]|nr:methionyl-tRNA formyltransferase [Mycoplasmataceae bacterium]
MIKILLAGTPNFSVPIFEKIINNFHVVGIVTQPDSRSGRGMKLISSPVKDLAIKYGIKLFQQDNISNIFDELKLINFDIFLTAAFGQLVPDNILSLAKIGSINIHCSLLPKYRGAAPIQHSILNGDKETGISLIYMINKMDAGDIIFTKIVKIDDDDSSDTLFKKMSIISSKEICNWLELFYNQKFNVRKQNIDDVTFASKLVKKNALLIKDSSRNMINKIRAYNSNPGAYLFINEKRVKIFNAITIENKNYLKIETLDGFIYSSKYQFEGKKIVDIGTQND